MRLAALAILVLLLLAVQALPLQAGQGPAAGWQLFEMQSDGDSGDSVRIQWTADMGSGVFGVEIKHMTKDRGGSFWIIFSGIGTEVLVSPWDVETPIPYSLELPSSWTITNLNGSYRFAVWAAGDIEDVALDVLPSGSTTVQKVAEGSSTFFSDGSGASSGVHAHATVDGPGVAYSDATYSFTVEHEFFGLAGKRDGFRYPQGPNPLLVRESDSEVIHGFPNGTTQVCYCQSPTSPHPGWGPGTHTLEWRGLDLYSRNEQPIHLAGVDIDLMMPAS